MFFSSEFKDFQKMSQTAPHHSSNFTERSVKTFPSQRWHEGPPKIPLLRYATSV